MQDQNTVKGLDVARAFFFEWGLPEVERQFPALVARVAAGKILGSDVLLPLLNDYEELTAQIEDSFWKP